MDTEFIHKQVRHMRPGSFSVRERQRYRAEKMLMRQFVLMKLHYQVPIYLSTKDMKRWLLSGRSFLDEFPEVSKKADLRKLLMAELVWTSARRLCVNQMEKELWEELKKERRLSLQFSRKVTLEGLRLFLLAIRPKAEQDVQILLHQLCNKLPNSLAGSHSNKRSKVALVNKLQSTVAPLVPRVVKTALDLLLEEPELRFEDTSCQNVRTQGVETSEDSGPTSSSATENRSEVASAKIAKQLAEAAAPCFCPTVSPTEARLLCLCTSAARDMVKAVNERLEDQTETFDLMDFDESAITAKEGALCAIQSMDQTARRDAYSWVLHQYHTKDENVVISVAPEECCVAAAQRSDEKKEGKQKPRVGAFISRMWKRVMRLLTKK